MVIFIYFCKITCMYMKLKMTLHIFGLCGSSLLPSLEFENRVLTLDAPVPGRSSVTLQPTFPRCPVHVPPLPAVSLWSWRVCAGEGLKGGALFVDWQWPHKTPLRSAFSEKNPLQLIFNSELYFVENTLCGCWGDSSSHQVAKVLEFQLQHQSFQWTPRTDLL